MGQDAECVDCTVSCGADDVVCGDAGNGGWERGCIVSAGAAPGRTDVAAVQACY